MFILLVSVTCDGTVLPFQAVYQGLTEQSLPQPSAPCYNDCIKAGFHFEFSGTKTYWSNQKTMRTFADHILAPYFAEAKAKAGCPSSQQTMWQIDVWAVHRSEEFQTWMCENHPTITVIFVPGGCTGVVQPCDVGVQRPLKLSVKQSYHEVLVNEVLEQTKEGKALTIDNQIGTHHNHSVQWLWNAYAAINQPDLIKMVCTHL